MATNYFVSYDLMNQKNYEAVAERIKSAGQAVKIQYSVWYVKSNLTIEGLSQHVWAGMDKDDRLLVIHAANAYWYNAIPGAQDFIQQRWNL